MILFKNKTHALISRRLAIVTLVTLGTLFWVAQSAMASSPSDPFSGPIPSVQIETEKTIVLSFNLKSETTGELVNVGARVIDSTPKSYIGTPFMWTGKVTTFDNDCPYAFPLYHPRLISMDEFNIDQEPEWGGWYRTGNDVNFTLSIPFIPTATEVEILDSALNSRGIFDVNPLLDTFCEENSDDPECEERRKKFYELLDLDEILQVAGASTIHFDDKEHYDGWNQNSIVSNFDENVLNIASSAPDDSFALALDLSKTDLSETYLNRGYSEQNEKNIAISLLGDKDSFITMKFEEPIGGIAMHLGLLEDRDYDSSPGPNNVSQIIGDAPFGSDEFKTNFTKLNMSPKQHDDEVDDDQDGIEGLDVTGKEATITLDTPVIAFMRGFDEDGELVGEIDTKLPAYPGIHQFWGFGAPFTSIKQVEIEFRSDIFNESFDHIVILPDHFEKLTATRMDVSSCSGPVPAYGAIELPPILPPELPRPGRVTSPVKEPKGSTVTMPSIAGDWDSSGSVDTDDIKIFLEILVKTPRELSTDTDKPSDEQMQSVDIYPRSRGDCGDWELNIFDALAILRNNQTGSQTNPCDS